MFRHRSPRLRSHCNRSPGDTLLSLWISLLGISLLAFPAFSHAQVGEAPIIRTIEFRGLSRLRAGEVKSRMRVREGQAFDARELDAEYQRLWKWGEFLVIEPPEVLQVADGVQIVITVVEKARVVDLLLVGNDKIDRLQIESKLTTRRNGLLSPYELQNDRRSIERLYLEKGFMFVDVQDEYRIRPEGAEVTFRIQEGPRVYIQGIEIQGNQAFEDHELIQRMVTRPRSYRFLIPGIPHSGIFNMEAYLADLDNLRRFYTSKGFFDAVVVAEDVAFNFDRDSLYLGVRVMEGDRYVVSDVDIEITGRGVFPESVLRAEIQTQVGEPFDGRTMSEDLDRLEAIYKNHAYLDAHAQSIPIIEQEGTDIRLLYRITEGSKVYIESVEIRGNVQTRDKVIRRELLFYPGEEVNLEKILESRSNLFRLDYFTNVSVREEPTTTPNRRNIIVEVDEDEKATGRMGFGAGITSGRGVLFNIALSKRNFDWRDIPENFRDIPGAFTGGGQTLALQAQPGSELSTYSAFFHEPHLFDTQTSLSLRALRGDFRRDQYREQVSRLELGLGQRFNFDRRLRGEVSYRWEKTDIGDIDVDSDADSARDVFGARGETRASIIRGEVTYDRRRYRPILGPVAGWLARVDYEYAGGPLGADLDISKARAHFSFYRTVRSDGERRRHILSFDSTFGWAEPHHNNQHGDRGAVPGYTDSREVPIFERYFLGGSRTVRGFRFRGLGPHLNQNAIGGTVEHFGRLQYTFPLVENVFRGALFADYGNLAENLGNFQNDEYRLALGFGVLISLPLFGQMPITLTWAEAVRKEAQDRTRNFLFDIGFGF